MVNVKRYMNYKTVEIIGKIEMVLFCLGIIMNWMFLISYYKWSTDNTVLILIISTVC